MSILIAGATGTIGSQVIAHLAGVNAEIRALTRAPEKATLPGHVRAVGGDLSDIGSVRTAMAGISTLFLLVPNLADEFTRAMLTLNVAREAGVKGIVYLSVYKGEAYTDVPHFAGKAAIEHMIAQANLPATILRPAYFIQNDLRQKDPLLGAGVYGMPIGQKGVSMVDTRDIGLAAARELMRREHAATPLPAVTYPLVGPDVLGSAELTALWSKLLGRPIRYGGDDLDILEQRLISVGPSWLAYDIKLMMRRYQTDGAAATPEDIALTTQVLGQAPRSYRAFAEDAAAQWTKS